MAETDDDRGKSKESIKPTTEITTVHNLSRH